MDSTIYTTPVREEKYEPVVHIPRLPRSKKPYLIIPAAVLVFFILWIFLSAVRYGSSVSVAIQGMPPSPADSGSLSFGALPPNTSATRIVVVENRSSVPMRIVILRKGSISELIRLNKNYFKAPPKSDTAVELNLYVPPSTPPGFEAEGTVTVLKIPFI